ncbi:MAG: hypothetical protein CK425_11810 [Parachlamydia sp.]|nr:MAG: hypothetical protein CK425_11810 [Parachlamydia sp.]
MSLSDNLIKSIQSSNLDNFPAIYRKGSDFKTFTGKPAKGYKKVSNRQLVTLFTTYLKTKPAAEVEAPLVKKAIQHLAKPSPKSKGILAKIGRAISNFMSVVKNAMTFKGFHTTNHLTIKRAETLLKNPKLASDPKDDEALKQKEALEKAQQAAKEAAEAIEAARKEKEENDKKIAETKLKEDQELEKQKQIEAERIAAEQKLKEVEDKLKEAADKIKGNGAPVDEKEAEAQALEKQKLEAQKLEAEKELAANAQKEKETQDALAKLEAEKKKNEEIQKEQAAEELKRQEEKKKADEELQALEAKQKEQEQKLAEEAADAERKKAEQEEAKKKELDAAERKKAEQDELKKQEELAAAQQKELEKRQADEAEKKRVEEEAKNNTKNDGTAKEDGEPKKDPTVVITPVPEGGDPLSKLKQEPLSPPPSPVKAPEQKLEAMTVESLKQKLSGSKNIKLYEFYLQNGERILGVKKEKVEETNTQIIHTLATNLIPESQLETSIRSLFVVIANNHEESNVTMVKSLLLSKKDNYEFVTNLFGTLVSLCYYIEEDEQKRNEGLPLGLQETKLKQGAFFSWIMRVKTEEQLTNTLFQSLNKNQANKAKVDSLKKSFSNFLYKFLFKSAKDNEKEIIAFNNFKQSLVEISAKNTPEDWASLFSKLANDLT